jgi:hypothetical protein
MRRPLYFDGAPDLFTRTKALFSTTSRLQVRYPSPDSERHALRRHDTRMPLATTRWNVLKRAA